MQSASRIFINTQAAERTPFFASPPIAMGGNPGDYLLERRKIGQGALATHTFDDHILMLPLGDKAVRFRSKLEGNAIAGLIEPTKFRFLARGDTLATEWDAPLEALFLTLSSSSVHGVFGEDIPASQFHFRSDILAPADKLLVHLMFALESHVQGDVHLGGKLLEESLMTAVAARFVQCFSTGLRKTRHALELPRWKYLRVEQFILDQLAQPLSLVKIAAAVNMSPYHLSRVFRAATGKSLWQFVLECRAQAAWRLVVRSPSMPLAQVADHCGFESYSQFIATFRKFHGQLPSELRRSLSSGGACSRLALRR